jgi:hypothetical protein
MRAVVQDAYGPSETLRLAEVDHIISVEPVEVPIWLLRRALTPTGTLVIVGGERWTGGTGRQMRALLLSPVVKQRLTTFISGEKHTDMERLAGFMQDGTVTPAVGQRYSRSRRRRPSPTSKPAVPAARPSSSCGRPESATSGRRGGAAARRRPRRAPPRRAGSAEARRSRRR